MNTSIHPIIYEEDGLPFIICGIGSQDKQCHIIRKDGSLVHQIIFTSKGSGTLIIENATFDIAEGTYLYLKPNEAHEYLQNEGGWATYWIQFRGENIERTLEKLGLTASKTGLYNNTITIQLLFNGLLSTLSGNDSFKGFNASYQFYTLLIELYRSSYSHTYTQNKQTTTIIKQVIQYIDFHFTREITLEELANISNITPQYLCKIFKDHLNMRPFEYIAKRRIQESKKLLSSGSLSIKDICKLVGYKDSSYFCAIFKKFESISPSEFRGAAKLHRLSDIMH